MVTLIDCADVDPPPLVTFPKSTTQHVFVKSDIRNIYNIAFTRIKYIAIASSLENQVGVTYNQQIITRFRMQIILYSIITKTYVGWVRVTTP
jgi:hypothetical protein